MEKQNKKAESDINGWKIAAIILLLVLIIENLGIGWLFYYGINLINEENNCAINICANYDSYIYDDAGTCYCYENGELVHQEYLRS